MEFSAILSTDSLDKLQRQLLEASDGVVGVSRDLTERAAQAALEEARRSCPEYTGALAQSIHIEETDNGFDVVTKMPYAAFVEFGTGAGIPSSEPDDVRAMSESGYTVNLSGKGRSGWVYPKGDQFFFTHGQSGRGFMAKGAEAARRIVATTKLKAIPKDD